MTIDKKKILYILNKEFNHMGDIKIDNLGRISSPSTVEWQPTKKQQQLPLEFYKIGGDFSVEHGNLTTLKGCPEIVGDTFSCDYNKLTTLEFGPKSANTYYCNNNKLINLDHIATNVREVFAEDNPLQDISYLTNCKKIEYVNFHWHPDLKCRNALCFLLSKGLDLDRYISIDCIRKHQKELDKIKDHIDRLLSTYRLSNPVDLVKFNFELLKFGVK